VNDLPQGTGLAEPNVRSGLAEPNVRSGSPATDVRPRTFADAVQVAPPKGGRVIRLGPIIGAAVVCLLVVLFAAVVPTLVKNPLGTSASPTPGAQSPGTVPAANQSPAARSTYDSSLPLTYASTLTVGPGAQCCAWATGTWSSIATGGAPDFTGVVHDSTDPGAAQEWALGQPAGGLRWDELKIRVWLPQTGQAWVRITVTTTASGQASVSSYDVLEAQYQGWYELPTTFMIGTPTERTGSAWVKMTYLAPYTGPGAASCGQGGCRRMAAAQVQFLWS
jgi:hypothetical protein